MLFTHDAIVEDETAASHLDVVQGEIDPGGIRIFGFRLVGKFVGQIGKIETAIVQTDNPRLWVLQPHLAQDDAPFEQGTRIDIGMEMIEPEKNLLAFALPDRQAIDIERHGKGIDTDLLDGYRTVQSLARLAHRDRLDDGRQHKETKQREDGDQNDKIKGVPNRFTGPVRPNQCLLLHEPLLPAIIRCRIYHTL